MDIQNFNSLFELFCVFNFAYVITDSLRNNDYVIQLGNRILKCFEDINCRLEVLSEKITGYETSLNTAKPPEGVDQIKEQFEKGKESFLAAKIEYNLSRSKIDSEISATFKTPSFIYLSLLSAFYCIIVLGFSGLSQNNDSAKIRQVDNSLLIILTTTLSFLLIGWWMDSNSKSGYKFANSIRKKIPKLKINWFLFVIAYTFILCLGGCLVYKYPIFEFNRFWHNVIAFISLIIPCLNFYAYFFKIRSRARKKRTDLGPGVDEIESNLGIVFTRVGIILAACSWFPQNNEKINVDFNEDIKS